MVQQNLSVFLFILSFWCSSWGRGNRTGQNDIFLIQYNYLHLLSIWRSSIIHKELILKCLIHRPAKHWNLVSTPKPLPQSNTRKVSDVQNLSDKILAKLLRNSLKVVIILSFYQFSSPFKQYLLKEICNPKIKYLLTI